MRRGSACLEGFEKGLSTMVVFIHSLTDYPSALFCSGGSSMRE